MRRLVSAAAVIAVMGLTGSVRADDKASPVGTWKWTVMGRNNQSREMTIKFKMDGDKLAGVSVGNDGTETALEDVTWKDGEVSFKIVRERNGQKRSTKYTGKLSGDTIKGKTESPGRGGGEPTKRDWEAKRAKD
jgi:hypothetical protein